MATPPSNRIPSDDLEDYRSWKIPEINDARKVLPSAEKEDRERRAKQKRAKSEVVGEDVEDVTPLTAEQINEIAEAARKQGYEDGVNEGKEVGHREGYAVGKLEAYDKYQSVLSKQTENLAALIEELQNPYQTQSLQLENLILKTVCVLTESVVKREMLTDSGHVRELVRAALGALPGGSDNITIYLSPDDLSVLDNFLLERAGDWQLKADRDLLPGGCRIETKQSLVDYSVEARLAHICEKYIQGELAGDESEEDDFADAFEDEPVVNQAVNQAVKQADEQAVKKEEQQEEKPSTETNTALDDNADNHPSDTESSSIKDPNEKPATDDLIDEGQVKNKLVDEDDDDFLIDDSLDDDFLIDDDMLDDEPPESFS